MSVITQEEVEQYLGFAPGTSQVDFNVDPLMVGALVAAISGAIAQAKMWGIAPSNKSLSDFSFKVCNLHRTVSPAGATPLQVLFVAKASDGQIEAFDAYLTFRSPMVTAISLLEL